jgi:RND family efflux transporter MFP subunit
MTRRNHDAVLALLILAVSAAGCGSSANQKAAAPPSVAVVKVSRGDLADNLEIASEFEPFQEIDVYAKVSGYIQSLDVDWGTHVKQGQLMAVLEIPELEQQLQQDEAAVKQSQQNLEGAQSALKSAQSAYDIAHLTYTRYADVQKTKPDLIAQEDIDVAQSKDQETSANVATATNTVNAASQQVIASQAALNRDKAMFAYARITAPFDGVVTQIYSYKGALLPAGTSSAKDTLALCRLSQNNLLRLVIPLPERAVADVHVGQTVAIRLSNPPKTLQGTISQFSGQIDQQTRTMHTEIHVPNPNYELVPGMYASVLIPLHSAKQVLTLPIQAVQIGNGNQATVLVVASGNHLEQRTIAIGLQTASRVEIVSGLQEGDSVVFGDQGQYQPGELVTPKLAESLEKD